MSIESITYAQKVSIANTLKELYFLYVVEEQFHDDSVLFHDIESLIDQNIKLQNEAIKDAGGTSLRFPSTEELANAFLEKYQKCVIAAEGFAYGINHYFGHSIDLANVIAPYFLYQAGVTDETFSFYVSLGLVVAKIICDSMALKKETRDDIADKEKIKTICNELINSLIIAKTYADENQQEALDKSIKEISKIRDLDK